MNTALVCACRQPRGFGFIQFLDPREAAEAQYSLDHSLIAGREITVVFAEENRKRPQEMRSKERFRGRPGFGARRGMSPFIPLNSVYSLCMFTCLLLVLNPVYSMLTPVSASMLCSSKAYFYCCSFGCGCVFKNFGRRYDRFTFPSAIFPISSWWSEVTVSHH